MLVTICSALVAAISCIAAFLLGFKEVGVGCFVVMCFTIKLASSLAFDQVDRLEGLRDLFRV